MSLRPVKLGNPLFQIKEHLAAGRFDFVAHARERLQQRQVTVIEVVYVLRHGFHERRKDQFREDFGEWVYAIKGKTPDARELRIAISISAGGALVITVIDVSK